MAVLGSRGRASLTGIGAGSVTASQVVVPGGRGPCLPRRTVTSRRRRTPRLAPHSGSSLEHALNERGWECSSIASNCSQVKNAFCRRKTSSAHASDRASRRRRARDLVSRAQRSTSAATWCAAEPGPFQTPPARRSRISGAPLRKSSALHRIRDTQSGSCRPARCDTRGDACSCCGGKAAGRGNRHCDPQPCIDPLPLRP